MAYIKQIEPPFKKIRYTVEGANGEETAECEPTPYAFVQAETAFDASWFEMLQRSEYTLTRFLVWATVAEHTGEPFAQFVNRIRGIEIEVPEREEAEPKSEDPTGAAASGESTG